MRYIIISVLSLLLACNNTALKQEKLLDVSSMHEFLKLHMQSSIANYESIYVGSPDSVFLTIDQDYDFVFYYQNNSTGKKEKWSYEDLKLKSKLQDFNNLYTFLNKQQRVINTAYYAIGYKIQHIYRDTLTNDTFSVEVRMDTNNNVKQVTLIN